MSTATLNLGSIAAIPGISLGEALALVGQRFDAAAIAGRSIDLDGVAEYYRQSDRGYRMFHSREGALHIALGGDGHRDTTGYARHAGLFRQHLDAIGARRAIEFGCGMGYNLRRLATDCPDREFVGVDLTAPHIDFAGSKASGLPNASFEVANYETLPHGDEAFDAVLAVETLCQTNDQPRALREALRVLRPGGRLVVIDCFRVRPIETYEPDLQRAMRLVEKTTAVDAFSVVDEWTLMAESAGLRLVEDRDLSADTRENLARLHSVARRFFRMPAAVRAMAKAFPPRLLENSICGLLMPYTVGAGAHTYRILVVEKPA